MARQTKAYRAGVLLERLGMGPSFHIHAADWHELGITSQAQATKLERHFAGQYQRWQHTWMQSQLEELLPK